MTDDRSPQISDQHVQRLAVRYERRSSLPQDRQHPGSVAHQRDQADYARQSGWPDSAIMVIEDLGVNGATADRPGFQRLWKMVERGEVGAVFVRDVSRLSRSQRDLELFFALCRAKDVIVVVDGEIMQLE